MEEREREYRPREWVFQYSSLAIISLGFWQVWYEFVPLLLKCLSLSLGD